MPERLVLSREQVIGYRLAVHDLAARGDAGAVLATGMQAHPNPRTAAWAWRLRTGAALPREGLVLVHSARAALHLHRAADANVLAGALHIDDGRSLTPATAGSFAAEIERAGVGFGSALDMVARAMRDVMSDGVPRTKGELSGAVTPLVDPRLAPWCPGCEVFHVDDLLFRAATLQATLGIPAGGEGRSASRYRQVAAAADVARPEARATVLRRFLHAFGPASPANLAAWLGMTPAAARMWWAEAEPDLVPVQVDGRPLWAHANDVAAITSAATPRGVRLLPPYDPFTELADREFAVPDQTLRRQVWRAAGIPGVLLVDGEVAGVWRQKTSGSRLTITVTEFRTLSADRRSEADADAHLLAAEAGAREAEVVFA